jgi:hypothetical protein
MARTNIKASTCAFSAVTPEQVEAISPDAGQYASLIA